MTDTENNTGNENLGMALSGMILGVIGLICAFMPNWRTIGLVISCVGLVVSIFSLKGLKKWGEKKVRATMGIILGIVGIAVSVVFLVLMNREVRETVEPIPTELQKNETQETDHNNALEKLQGLTDSSETPKQ